MSDRLKNLARRFSVRTERMKEKVVQPATPESEKRSIDDEATSGIYCDAPGSPCLSKKGESNVRFVSFLNLYV